VRIRLSGQVLGVALLSAGLLAGIPATASAYPRATVAIACGDIAGLNAAITAANAGTGPSNITLAPNCAYQISVAAGSSVFGPVALPEVTGVVTLTGHNTSLVKENELALFRIAAVSGTGAILTVQGITASDGLVSGSGGCYSATSDAELVLRDSAATGCMAFTNGGGMIVNDGATADIEHSVIDGNTGGDAGGAIYADGSAVVTITSSYLGEDQAALGGAIYADGQDLNIAAATITENQADDEGGGLYNDGVLVHIAGTTFNLNTAGTKGGAISNYGTTTLRNTTISANSAPLGGGVWQGGGSVTPILTVIAGNTPNNCRPGGLVPGCYP
jgi:predicted outer membrane repeat protein